MKKVVSIFLMALSLIFTTNLLMAQVEKAALQTNAEKVSLLQPVENVQDVGKPIPPAPTEAILYSQLAPWNGNLSTAQDFLDFAADANVADDFIVPTGETWDINAVKWVGGYYNGTGPLVSVNIAFYNDATGSPNPTPITSFNIASYTFANNQFIAALPSTVSLTEGTYWISIQGVMAFGSGGQYGFGPNDNTAPINNPMHRKDIEGYWGWLPTNTWVPVTDPSIGNTSDFDMCFELLDAVPQDPILVSDPESPFAFGNVALNNTVTQTFTLQNIGGGVINISAITLDATSDAAFSITNISTLPAALPPDAVTFDIEFTPTAEGIVTATVNITEDLTDGITTIQISGKGVIPPSNDDCANPIAITGPYPQTVSGSTVDATPDCFPDYSVWYTVDLPYDLNLVTIDFCPTATNLGTELNSVYPYLGVDCSCAFFNFSNLVWDCGGLTAPSYEFLFIGGPGTATLPIAVRNAATDSWEVDFEVIVDVQPYVSVDLTVFLEGPYAGGGMMNTDLNDGGYLPLNQPYNPALPYYDNGAPEWLYSGTENVAAIPSADIVDWVYIQLRDANDAATATSASTVADAAVFLTSSGKIVDLDGTSRVAFGLLASDIGKGLYAVVYHRNHLGIISNNALTLSGPSFVYDFSSGETQVYGGTNGHKQLEPGVWGMVAADGNGNGLVQNTDETAVWKLDLGGSGYQGGDFNMNGLTQNTDETDTWKPNLGAGGQVPAKAEEINLIQQNTGYESQIPD